MRPGAVGGKVTGEFGRHGRRSSGERRGGGDRDAVRSRWRTPRLSSQELVVLVHQLAGRSEKAVSKGGEKRGEEEEGREGGWGEKVVRSTADARCDALRLQAGWHARTQIGAVDAREEFRLNERAKEKRDRQGRPMDGMGSSCFFMLGERG